MGDGFRKVEDGWLILNGEKYQDEMAIINRRAQKAKYEAARRARMKGLPTSVPSGRELRYEEALKAGAIAIADAIAAEGLPETANSETNQTHEIKNIKDQTGAGN